jgi:hypothetical protein
MKISQTLIAVLCGMLIPGFPTGKEKEEFPLLKKHYKSYIKPHLSWWIQEWIGRFSHEN